MTDLNSALERWRASLYAPSSPEIEAKWEVFMARFMREMGQ
jgi:hypothetical protein